MQFCFCYVVLYIFFCYLLQYNLIKKLLVFYFLKFYFPQGSLFQSTIIFHENHKRSDHHMRKPNQTVQKCMEVLSFYGFLGVKITFFLLTLDIKIWLPNSLEVSKKHCELIFQFTVGINVKFTSNQVNCNFYFAVNVNLFQTLA